MKQWVERDETSSRWRPRVTAHVIKHMYTLTIILLPLMGRIWSRPAKSIPTTPKAWLLEHLTTGRGAIGCCIRGPKKRRQGTHFGIRFLTSLLPCRIQIFVWKRFVLDHTNVALELDDGCWIWLILGNKALAGSRLLPIIRVIRFQYGFYSAWKLKWMLRQSSRTVPP